MAWMVRFDKVNGDPPEHRLDDLGWWFVGRIVEEVVTHARCHRCPMPASGVATTACMSTQPQAQRYEPWSILVRSPRSRPPYGEAVVGTTGLIAPAEAWSSWQLAAMSLKFSAQVPNTSATDTCVIRELQNVAHGRSIGPHR
jgi:hypothetical protein